MTAVMEGTKTYLQWLTADASDINVRFTGSNDGTNGIVTATSDFAATYLKGFNTDTADDTCVANVGFVKSQLQDEHAKNSAVASSTSNVDLTTLLQAGQTFDSATLAAGDRVLLVNQDTASENGLWEVQASGAPQRPADFDASAEIAGASIWITDGANSGAHYIVTTPARDAGFTLGSDTITLTATAASGGYTAGDGLDLNATEFSVDLKANGGLVIESTELAVDLAASAITGQLAYSNLATLNDGQIVVGNAGTATVATMSGDATIDNTGALTIADNAVTLAMMEDGSGNEVLIYDASGAPTRLEAGTEGYVLTINSGAPTWAAASGTPAPDSVTSNMIQDNTIMNIDINPGANIAFTKLAPLSSGNILVGNVSDEAASVTMSGDATIDNTGAVTIADNAVTLAMMEDGSGNEVLIYDASGAPTRLDAGSEGQVLTISSGTPTWAAATGGAPGNDTVTSAMIVNGTIVDEDINASAAITATKVNLATLTAGTGLDGTASTYNAQSAATISINANQTAIQTIYNNDLIVGNAANQETITFDNSNNRVNLTVDGTVQLYTTDENGTGKTYFRGGYQVYSDERIKSIPQVVDDALERIDGMDCVRYHLKRRDGTFSDEWEIGQIAQVTNATAPELVRVTDGEGLADLHTINYGGLAALGVHGVKLLHARVKSLETENQELRNLIADLASRVTRLEE